MRGLLTEVEVFVSMLSLLCLFFCFFFLFPDGTTESWVNCVFHHDLYRTADLALFNGQVLFLYELISFTGLLIQA